MWVFTRSGSTWTQEGAKLTAKSGEEGQYSAFGYRVALSGNGDTALIGSFGYGESSGASVFVRPAAETGGTGPTGPTGPTGATGATGVTGAQLAPLARLVRKERTARPDQPGNRRDRSRR